MSSKGLKVASLVFAQAASHDLRDEEDVLRVRIRSLGTSILAIVEEALKAGVCIRNPTDDSVASANSNVNDKDTKKSDGGGKERRLRSPSPKAPHVDDAVTAAGRGGGGGGNGTKAKSKNKAKTPSASLAPPQPLIGSREITRAKSTPSLLLRSKQSQKRPSTTAAQRSSFSNPTSQLAKQNGRSGSSSHPPSSVANHLAISPPVCSAAGRGWKSCGKVKPVRSSPLMATPSPATTTTITTSLNVEGIGTAFNIYNPFDDARERSLLTDPIAADISIGETLQFIAASMSQSRDANGNSNLGAFPGLHGSGGAAMMTAGACDMDIGAPIYERSNSAAAAPGVLSWDDFISAYGSAYSRITGRVKEKRSDRVSTASNGNSLTPSDEPATTEEDIEYTKALVTRVETSRTLAAAEHRALPGAVLDAYPLPAKAVREALSTLRQPNAVHTTVASAAAASPESQSENVVSRLAPQAAGMAAQLTSAEPYYEVIYIQQGNFAASSSPLLQRRLPHSDSHGLLAPSATEDVTFSTQSSCSSPRSPRLIRGEGGLQVASGSTVSGTTWGQQETMQYYTRAMFTKAPPSTFTNDMSNVDTARSDPHADRTSFTSPLSPPPQQISVGSSGVPSLRIADGDADGDANGQSCIPLRLRFMNGCRMDVDPMDGALTRPLSITTATTTALAATRTVTPGYLVEVPGSTKDGEASADTQQAQQELDASSPAGAALRINRIEDWLTSRAQNTEQRVLQRRRRLSLAGAVPGADFYYLACPERNTNGREHMDCSCGAPPQGPRLPRREGDCTEGVHSSNNNNTNGTEVVSRANSAVVTPTSRSGLSHVTMTPTYDVILSVSLTPAKPNGVTTPLELALAAPSSSIAALPIPTPSSAAEAVATPPALTLEVAIAPSYRPQPPLLSATTQQDWRDPSDDVAPQTQYLSIEPPVTLAV